MFSFSSFVVESQNITTNTEGKAKPGKKVETYRNLAIRHGSESINLHESRFSSEILAGIEKNEKTQIENPSSRARARLLDFSIISIP